MSGEDLATLGIKVDATQVDASVPKMDAATAAGARLEAQTERLTAATQRQGESQNRSSRETATATARFESLQSGINRSLGLTDQALKSASRSATEYAKSLQGQSALEAARSTAVYGVELDKLRAKYNPLYAASMQYSRALDEIAHAERVGALATMEAAKARETARMSFERMATPINGVGKAAGLSSFHMQNLGYQINDVVSGLAMGQSPFRILTQQGGQFVQIMQQGGLGPIGLIKALGASLGAAGVIAVGVAAAIGGAFAVATQQINKESGDLTKGLGLSADQLDRVKNRYVTFGDTVKATFQVLWDRIKGGFEGTFSWLGKAYQWLVDTTKSAVATYVGIWIGAFNVLREAYKLLPKWMGGEGKSFDTANFTSAFMAGIKDTKKAFDDFYSDVATKARSNAVERIKDQAGKAGRNPDSGKLDSAARELEATKLQLAEQVRLNKAVQEGTMTSADAEQAIQRTANARRIEAMAAGTTGETYKKLMAIVKQLIVVDNQLNEARDNAKLLQVNDQMRKQLEILREEYSLIRSTNRERATALANARAQQELSSGRLGAFDPSKPTSDQQKYLETQRAIALAQIDLKDAQDEYNASLSYTSELMQLIDEQAQSATSALAEAFGDIGSAVGDLVTTMTGFAVQQQQIAERQLELAKEGKQGTIEYDLLTRKAANNQVNYYGDMIGAAKGFFQEGSAGYKILQTAEAAYRAYQLAASLQAMITKSAEAATAVAANGTIAASGVTAGAASIFAALGPFGFPVVAAMLAVMAGLGFGGGGGGGSVPAIDVAKDRQKAQGAGSVLGDASAKSESIANSIEQLAKDTNTDLEYSNQMVTSLKAIQAGIGSLTGLLARQLQVGGLFDISSLNLGTSGGGGGGLLGGLIGGLFGSSKTTTELVDQGIQIYATSVGEAITQGIRANSYQTVKSTTEKSGALFGLIGGGTSTSTKTTNSALGEDFTSSISDIVSGLRSVVLDAATKLGVEGAGAVIDSLNVNIGNISFKDMTGSEIQDALNAVFSKLGDEMAETAFPVVSSLQKVGEGALETLARLVREYTSVDNAAKMIGFTFNAVGISSLAARDRVVQLSGGLDEFSEQANFFVDNFLTGAQAIKPVAKSVSDEMTRLGYVGITTKQQFTALVQSLDVATASGAELYAQLMAVAPAFSKVAEAAEDIANQKLDLQIQLLNEIGATTEAVAFARKRELDALDASLVPLQKAVYAAEDLNTASDNLEKTTKALTDAQNNYANKSDAVAAAQEKLNQLLNPTLSATDKLTDAHSNLANAYNAESSALNDTISRLTDMRLSLIEFRKSLDAGELAGNDPKRQYAVTRSAFLSTDPSSANFQQAASDFLAASRVASVNSAQYNRDLAAVKNATNLAITQAQTQIDTATLQLNALNASVAGLGILNESVMSVADALAAYTVAQAAAEVDRAGEIAKARADLLAAQEAQQAAFSALQTAAEAQTAAIDANAVAITGAISALHDLVGTSYGSTIQEIANQTAVEQALGAYIGDAIVSLKVAAENNTTGLSGAVLQLGATLSAQLATLGQIMAGASQAQAAAVASVVAAAKAAADAANNAATKQQTNNSSGKYADDVARLDKLASDALNMLNGAGVSAQWATRTNVATGELGSFFVNSNLWDDPRNAGIAATFAQMQREYIALFAQAQADYAAMPGHAMGLSNVPYDNYRAKLHSGEGVLTRAENSEWKRNRGSNDNAAVVNELRAMRRDFEAGRKVTEANSKRIDSLVRRFVGEGDEGQYLKVKDVG